MKSLPPTITVDSDAGHRTYHIDNSGEKDVSSELQKILDEAAHDTSATITFSPGIYYINKPLTVQISSIRLVGQGHGGTEMHGMNLAGGSILRFGPKCGPDCIRFEYSGQDRAFPSRETPWPYQVIRVDVENMTFAGYNNTGVDTASGYSRFRGDKPDFRGLSWYPAPGRYTDVEQEGQRALVIPSAKPGQKAELLRLTNCYFTDLYVGADIASCDVSYITNCWFAQMAYGIRYHGPGQCMFVSNNCFADLETGMILAHPIMSTFHHNSFAYVSKCFEIAKIEHSSITGNTLYNWERSTGAATHGAFCYIGGPSMNITMTGNSIRHELDSRAKRITIDTEPSGRSFMQFENCERLLLSNNVINTVQTQTVIRLHDCTDCVVTDNIITHGPGGTAVAETGNCCNNYYRPVEPQDSHLFDPYNS
jgi:hypothetical protein